MLADLLNKKNIKSRYKINIKTKNNDDVLIISKKRRRAPLGLGLNTPKKKLENLNTNPKVIVKKKNYVF